MLPQFIAGVPSSPTHSMLAALIIVAILSSLGAMLVGSSPRGEAAVGRGEKTNKEPARMPARPAKLLNPNPAPVNTQAERTPVTPPPEVATEHASATSPPAVVAGVRRSSSGRGGGGGSSASGEREDKLNGFACYKTKSPICDDDKLKLLLDPYLYITQKKGKGVRNMLIDAWQAWLDITPSTLGEIKLIIEKLHNASLLIDDIEDGSLVRRGRPVAHKIFGEASTINCANLVYFEAMGQCSNLGNAAALQLFLEEMVNLHRGQGLDIWWRDNHVCPSIQEYEDMVKEKTGGLFRLAVGLMQAFSKNTESFDELVNMMGLFFQVRDDYVNLKDREYMMTKTFCEDITEGKYSFPIIHAIMHDPSDRRIQNVLKQRTENKDMIQCCVEYIAQCGSFDYTLKYLQDLNTRIEAEIARLGGNARLSKLVEKMNAGLTDM